MSLSLNISKQREERRKAMAEPHTLEYTELTTRIQTMNKAIYYIIRITTGGSVRARKLTPMHIHRQHEMEPLLEALGLSTKQRKPPKTCTK